MFKHPEAYASIFAVAPNGGQATRREASGLFLSRYQLSRPYATDDVRQGQYRTSREDALTKRYIQFNPRPLVFCLVIDIDKEDALLRAFRPDLPMPSWVAQSPSGRAHAGYLLERAFSTTDVAQIKSVRLGARVEEALRRQVGGDPGFNGLITKNPLHQDWETVWGSDELHSLSRMAADLAGCLPDSRPRKGYRHDVAGLGRNCLLFEDVRHWSYQAVRRYWEDGLPAFQAATLDRLTVQNEQFPVPLPLPEVRALAKTISVWTWERMTPQGFQAVQKERSTKGNQVKTARAREREEAVLRLRAEGHRWQVIADSLGMSLDAAKAIARRSKKVSLPISNMGT